MFNGNNLIQFRLGVPISSQWKTSGHIYPIQVGQFGLSYFSKWIQTSQSENSYKQPFIIKDAIKFVHHSNKIPLSKSTPHGFEFSFSGKFFKVKF